MKRPRDESEIIAVLARNVRAARQALGLSQEELAHEAGIDRTYVSQVERGLRNVTISVLAKIAKALNTMPDKLLVSSGPMVRQGRGRRSSG